jgi:hypothetical protein
MTILPGYFQQPYQVALELLAEGDDTTRPPLGRFVSQVDSIPDLSICSKKYVMIILRLLDNRPANAKPSKKES